MIIPAYMVKDYFDFCVERHSIYVRRFEHNDPWPWTDDEVLQTYKFTNVFRELDTGTIYCRKYIREPYAEHPELFFNIVLYRYHNRIETQRYLGHFIEDYNPNRVVDKVKKYRDVGNTVFTGAYMITSHLGSSDKTEGMFGNALGDIWYRRRELEPQPGDSLQDAFNRLNGNAIGMGPFNTYEIITDLRWTRYLCDAADIYDWANPGPGAKRGIARIINNNDATTKGMKSDDYLYVMRYLVNVQRSNLPGWFPPMEMRDIEHSLCEFDKYMRVKCGEGRPRGKFKPPHLR